MPIKGMTDELAVARFPRLGKLRKGAEKQNNRPGKNLENYFRFTSPNPAIERAFLAAYGDKPNEIEVELPYADIEDNFPTWYELWSGGGLVHRCDSKTMYLWQDQRGEYQQTAKPCPFANLIGTEERRKAGACVPCGTLNLIIPALLDANYIGYVTMETHAKGDILAIHSVLLAVANECGEHGLQGVGWTLFRQTENISTPGKDGKRMRRDDSQVRLVPSARWVRAQQAKLSRIAYQQIEADDMVIEGESEDVTGLPPRVSSPVVRNDEEEPIKVDAELVDDDDDDAPAKKPPTPLAPEKKEWDASTTPLATGDPAAEAKKKAEKWVSAFVSKACTHYAPAGTDPDLLEPKIYEELGTTHAEMIQAHIERKLDAIAMKKKLDEAIGLEPDQREIAF